MIDGAALDPSGRPSLVESLLRWRLNWVPRSVSEVYVPLVAMDLDIRPHRPESVDHQWRSFAELLETGADRLSTAAAADREERRQAAVRARSLAAFAAQRPAVLLDRPAEEVGAAAAASREARPAVLTAVSEWAVDEVMVALGLSSQAASTMLAESVALVEQLPATLEALESGVLSYAHVRMLIEVLAPLSDDVRAEVEASLLSRAAGRTVSQLRASARRAVLQADAGAAARRLAQAIRERKVRMFPGEDGMASLIATLPLPLALACTKAIEGYAGECRTPDDERTKDQRTADCFVDLLLRAGGGDAPPVRVDLTVVASADTLKGGDEPGELDGHPVPGVMVREVAYALDLLPRPYEQPAQVSRVDATDSEPTDSEPTDTEPTGTEPAAVHPTDSEPIGAAVRDERRARLADLLKTRTTSGTALSKLPAVAVVDEISGQLLALTSATEILRIANSDDGGIGPPPDTPGYSPSAPLERFVRARDRRCLFPGCRAPAIRCDLDHNVPWPAGATSEGNLCCLCRHHHRLSHQAPGWGMRRLPDGGLEWTTPGGDRITNYPPRYGSDDGVTVRGTSPPLTLRERVLGRPPTSEEVANDPTPF